MKILYVLSGTTIYGGATKAFMNLLKGVRILGIEACVFCPDNGGIYSELVSNGIPVSTSNFRFACWPPSRCIFDLFLFVPRLLHHVSIAVSI